MKRSLLVVIMALIAFPGFPWSVAADTMAYIPNGDGNVTRVDVADETFDSAELGDTPFGAAVTPNGLNVLITRRGDQIDPGFLTLIPTSNFLSTTGQIQRTVGVDPRGVAVDSAGRFAYVANFEDDTLSRIDMASLTVRGQPIDVGDGPFGVAAFFDEARDVTEVYVSNNSAGTVSVISDDGTTADTDATITVGSSPVGIAVTPDGSLVFVANNGSDNVSIIQTSDNTVIGTLNIGTEPWGVAAGSNGDVVYVTNSGDDTVTVIDTATLGVQNTFTVGDQPMGVAATKNGDIAYVVNQVANTISRIDVGAATVSTIGSGEISNASALGAFIGGTPPNAPSDLSAVTQSSGEIELTWTDNSDDELGFRIEQREDSEEDFIQAGEADGNATSFSAGSLSSNTTYHFRVRAFNEAADSIVSSEASATTDEGTFSWCFIQTLLRGPEDGGSGVAGGSQ